MGAVIDFPEPRFVDVETEVNRHRIKLRNTRRRLVDTDAVLLELADRLEVQASYAAELGEEGEVIAVNLSFYSAWLREEFSCGY